MLTRKGGNQLFSLREEPWFVPSVISLRAGQERCTQESDLGHLQLEVSALSQLFLGPSKAVANLLVLLAQTPAQNAETAPMSAPSLPLQVASPLPGSASLEGLPTLISPDYFSFTLLKLKVANWEEKAIFSGI